MKKIAFFNNKGGVGKTTLVCNIAHNLATDQSFRVLLIDLDPQCNSTQLLLNNSLCAKMYWPDEAAGDGAAPDTIYNAVLPLEEGEALPVALNPLEASANRFGIDLVPGHPRLSVFEDQLGQWFRDSTSGDIAGLRKTLWLENLMASVESGYDVVLFDLGPSLGALNRSVLAASDFFITPMGADIFSVIALRNIAEWISHWSRLYEQGVKLCAVNSPGNIEKFGVATNLPIVKGFAGYTVQQYSTVTIRGERRATLAYDEILNKVPSQIEKHLKPLVAEGLKLEQVKLGDIPNLRSLVPLAQSANSPLADLQSKDGLTGGQYSQQRTYVELINRVAKQLAANCLKSDE